VTHQPHPLLNVAGEWDGDAWEQKQRLPMGRDLRRGVRARIDHLRGLLCLVDARAGVSADRREGRLPALQRR
jgi:hypothetical protein